MSDERSWPIWCAHALEHVRFKPDCKAIEKELTAHYEDHKRDLERIGYEPNLASERALRAMGDSSEVGRALNQAHKPWLGWLWEVSRVLVLSLFLLTAVILLRNSQWTAQEMIDRTVDQFTWQAPPVGGLRRDGICHAVSGPWGGHGEGRRVSGGVEPVGGDRGPQNRPAADSPLYECGRRPGADSN